MINPKEFSYKLKEYNVDFISGVPDSLLKSLISTFDDIFANHIITANEGMAIAMAAGHYLATKKIAAIYMQNSGLGNCINPILSLIDEDVYNIPFLMIIGYRGEPNTKDEPQHYKQGLLTTDLLDCIGIKYKIFSSLDNIDEAFEYIKKTNNPYAIIIKKNTFINNGQKIKDNNFTISREEAIIQIAENANDNDIFISTTGMISRELYEYRKNNNKKCQDFYTVGSMGYVASIAYSIAMAKKSRRVYILDGDGACLMQMGSMTIFLQLSCSNICHIILNNASHDSVGGFDTVGNLFDFSKFAMQCGYKHVFVADNVVSLINILNDIKELKESIFIEVKVKKGNRKDLGRPKETPIENKKIFMEFLDNG